MVKKRRDWLVGLPKRVGLYGIDGELVADWTLMQAGSHPALFKAAQVNPKKVLGKTEYRCCVDIVRRVCHLPTVSLEDLEREPMAPETGASRVRHRPTGMRRTPFWIALNALPERQRFCLILYHMSGLSRPQIARRLHLTLPQVRYAVRCGEKRMRTLLGYFAEHGSTPLRKQR